MMQRIWAAIAAVWAVVAIFAVLAFARPAPTMSTGSAVVMARSANGQLVPVAPATGAHATTSSSGVPVSSGGAGQAVTYVKTAAGTYVPVASTAGSAAAVTRSS